VKQADSKTKLVASLARLFSRAGRRGAMGHGLAVLAYHRVGDRAAAAYDPWVYTADESQLDEHLRYIKKHRRLVGMEEALEIAAGRIRSPGPATLLTFDDGYLDNYQTAFPILKNHGAEGVFFLVTNFASGGLIPWWDQIAWIVSPAAWTVLN